MNSETIFHIENLGYNRIFQHIFNRPGVQKSLQRVFRLSVQFRVSRRSSQFHILGYSKQFILTPAISPSVSLSTTSLLHSSQLARSSDIVGNHISIDDHHNYEHPEQFHAESLLHQVRRLVPHRMLPLCIQHFARVHSGTSPYQHTGAYVFKTLTHEIPNNYRTDKSNDCLVSGGSLQITLCIVFQKCKHNSIDCQARLEKERHAEEEIRDSSVTERGTFGMNSFEKNCYEDEMETELLMERVDRARRNVEDDEPNHPLPWLLNFNIDLIDGYSRVIFPLCFLFFNVGYWLYFMYLESFVHVHTQLCNIWRLDIRRKRRIFSNYFISNLFQHHIFISISILFSQESLYDDKIKIIKPHIVTDNKVTKRER